MTAKKCTKQCDVLQVVVLLIKSYAYLTVSLPSSLLELPSKWDLSTGDNNKGKHISESRETHYFKLFYCDLFHYISSVKNYVCMNTNTEAFFSRFYQDLLVLTPISLRLCENERRFSVEAIFHLGSKARVSEIKLSGSGTSDNNQKKKKMVLPKNIPKYNWLVSRRYLKWRCKKQSEKCVMFIISWQDFNTWSAESRGRSIPTERGRHSRLQCQCGDVETAIALQVRYRPGCSNPAGEL